MSDQKMRAEFERTNGRDHRRQPPKGNNYIDPMAQADWEAFQKVWMQSRAALVIELPAGKSLSERMYGPQMVGGDSLIDRSEAIQSIEAAGARVQP